MNVDTSALSCFFQISGRPGGTGPRKRMVERILVPRGLLSHSWRIIAPTLPSGSTPEATIACS